MQTLLFLLPVLVLAVGLVIAHKAAKPRERRAARLTPGDDRYYRELHTALRMATATARSQMRHRR
jgi:hypothetical protein